MIQDFFENEILMNIVFSILSIFYLLAFVWIYRDLKKFRNRGININPGAQTLLYSLGFIILPRILPFIGGIFYLFPILYLIQRYILKKKLKALSESAPANLPILKSSVPFFALAIILYLLFVVALIILSLALK